jgi:hypothetical protein
MIVFIDKNLKYVGLFVAILIGLMVGYIYPQPNEAMAGSCNYEYCASNGYCYANQNGTNCYGINGNFPCTSSKPCATRPGQTD